MRRWSPSGALADRTGSARSRGARVDFSRSAPYFVALLLLALVAFWPTYLSRIGAATAYTHAHAVLATAWLLLLIAQPLAIRDGRLTRHRTLGRISYVLAPVIVVSVILLAHSRITGLEGPAFAGQSYLLWLQLSLVTLFALSYGLAIWTRHDMALHARFMVCTGLTLIDPVVVRLMLWIEAPPAFNYQWVTFGLTDALILAFIWLERDSRRGRRVFPVMLPVFILAQLPAVLQLTSEPWWQAFAGWFAALPLT